MAPPSDLESPPSAPPRWSTHGGVRGADYDRRFTQLERTGHDVHGEANFVCGYQPRSVLDAGCGTGRVAIELDRRGVYAVGIDADERMLNTAVEKAPHIAWYLGDLSTLTLCDDDGQVEQFDVALLAGNVMIFVAPGTEGAVVEHLARHLVHGGLLISGFQLGRGYEVDQFDADCAQAGLELIDRFGTWNRDAFVDGAPYAVSVHRLPRERRLSVSEHTTTRSFR